MTGFMWIENPPLDKALTMKLSYLRKDRSFISSLEAITMDHFYVYPNGIQDVNFPIWMMYFGIMNPFLGVMNGSDMKMPQR